MKIIQFQGQKLIVMVHAQVGKEFPDMRQDEKRMKFIRVGDAISQLKREWDPFAG